MLIRTLAIALCFAFPVLGSAQTPELKLPSFDHLRAKATESVDITLGTWPLKIAAFFMDEHDADQADVKDVLRNLKAVRVVSYSFDSDFEYPQQEIRAVREQLQREGWSQLVQVRNRGDGSSVDICVIFDEDGKRTRGLAVVAIEPREFTIINLVGSIDLESLARLEGHAGVPRLKGLQDGERMQ